LRSKTFAVIYDLGYSLDDLSLNSIGGSEAVRSGAARTDNRNTALIRESEKGPTAAPLPAQNLHDLRRRGGGQVSR
jgi:hypothetical protein